MWFWYLLQLGPIYLEIFWYQILFSATNLWLQGNAATFSMGLMGLLNSATLQLGEAPQLHSIVPPHNLSSDSSGCGGEVELNY